MSASATLIIPAYNAAFHVKTSLSENIRQIRARLPDAEVIIVDDGSTDDTAELLSSVPGVRVERNESNRGKGAAIRRGLLAAGGDVCVFTDVDFPYGIDDIVSIVARLRSGCDLVVGNRYLPRDASFVTVTLLRGVASWVCRRLIRHLRLIPRAEFSDSQCGLKGFSKRLTAEILERSTIDRFMFDVEVIHLAMKSGLRIEQAPVTLRNNSQSSVRLGRDLPLGVLELFRIRMNSSMGRYDPT